MQNIDSNQSNLTDGQRPPDSYSKSQKIAAASLAFFAVLVLVMWTIQFKSNLRSPFIYKGDDSAQTDDTNIDEDTDDVLKTKDTDSDGLSDYDELNTYKTSPYIEDSDSDSFKDKEEIDSGKDPNCPAGRDCNISGVIDGNTNLTKENEELQDSTLDNLLKDYSELSKIADESATQASGLSETDLANLMSGDINAATLREMLISAGMDKTTLDKITDEELMASYNESLKKQ